MTAGNKALNKKLGKARLIKDIKKAIEELKLVRAGKKSARNAEDFLNELKLNRL